MTILLGMVVGWVVGWILFPIAPRLMATILAGGFLLVLLAVLAMVCYS